MSPAAPRQSRVEDRFQGLVKEYKAPEMKITTYFRQKKIDFADVGIPIIVSLEQNELVP